MTKELKEALDRELDAALESGDPKLIDRAIINSQKSVADCQLKTAARVERVTAALDEKRAEYVEKRDAAKLPTTKALYQAFIDAIDRIKERLAIESE